MDSILKFQKSIDMPFLNQGDKKVKLIILLYSKYSQKSLQVLNTISLPCREYYKLISVDNKIIKEQIKNSYSVKVKQVPSIALVYEDGLVLTCEGESCIDVVTNIEQYNQDKNKEKNKGFTPLETIPIQKKIIKKRNDEEDFNGGMNSKRTEIKKGEGHSNMGLSSIRSNIEDNTVKIKKKKVFKVEGAETLDEDLDDMINEDPTLDIDIKKSYEIKKKDTKGVQNLAAQMMKEREQDLKDNVEDELDMDDIIDED
jgi:hypothetical protein